MNSSAEAPHHESARNTTARRLVSVTVRAAVARTAMLAAAISSASRCAAPAIQRRLAWSIPASQAPGSDAAAIQERADLVSRHCVVPEWSMPLPVPVGAAGHEQSRVARDALHAEGVGWCNTRAEALDALEADLHEARQIWLEAIGSRVCPHRDAAGLVNERNRARGIEQLGGKECRRIIADVPVERLCVRLDVSALQQCAGEVGPPERLRGYARDGEDVVVGNAHPDSVEQPDHLAHALASPARGAARVVDDARMLRVDEVAEDVHLVAIERGRDFDARDDMYPRELDCACGGNATRRVVIGDGNDIDRKSTR